MNAAKKKRRSATAKVARYRPPTPAQRQEEVYKEWKSPASLTDDEARHWARVIQGQADYEEVYAQIPKGRSEGEDRKRAAGARHEIHKLLVAHPTLANKPAALWKYADKSMVGHLDKKRWANLVGEVRKAV
jgi:hypothetical protein